MTLSQPSTPKLWVCPSPQSSRADSFTPICSRNPQLLVPECTRIPLPQNRRTAAILTLGAVTVFQQDMLKDRAIFLTGGGTGLGRSMALHFAMLGARMFLVGRREQPLKDVCNEIQRGGGSAAFATCDIRDYGAVETVANLAYAP